MATVAEMKAGLAGDLAAGLITQEQAQEMLAELDDADTNDEQDRRERADMVREAQDMLLRAIDLIEIAVKDTGIEDNVDAYVTAHLKIMASDNHGYMSRDQSLDDVIRKLEGREEEEW